MSIRAGVVDIRTDRPTPADKLWVDSNVWFWVAYSRHRSTPQTGPYLAYIKALRLARASLVAGGINYAELAKCIEIHEMDVYAVRNNQPQRSLNVKAFRSILTERANVIGEVAAAWSIVRQFATVCASALTDACVGTALKGLESGDRLDGHDAIQVAEARRNSVTDILTDDRDYGTVEGIRVFTANAALVGEARSAGTLISRR